MSRNQRAMQVPQLGCQKRPASCQEHSVKGFHPAILSDYVSLNCRQTTETYRKSLTRTKRHGRQPSVVEGQPQYDALDASGSRQNRQHEAIVNLQDIHLKGRPIGMDVSSGTVGTLDTSTYCNTCNNKSITRRRSQQLNRSSSSTLGRWIENSQKQPWHRRISSLNSVSTDHAECLRFSMRSLSSSNTLQTMATTTANSQSHSASCSPTFSHPSNRQVHKSASRMSDQRTNSSSNARWSRGLFNIFHDCLNRETKPCRGGLDVPTTNHSHFGCAIPEEKPSESSQEETQQPIDRAGKSSTNHSCLPTPEWLTNLLNRLKRPPAFHFDSNGSVSRQEYVQKPTNRCEGYSLDSTLNMSNSRGLDVTHCSACPRRSESTCSAVSHCSCEDDDSTCTSPTRDDVSIGASHSKAKNKSGSFCTSGTGSSIVDRTPDQVMFEEEMEKAESNNAPKVDVDSVVPDAIGLDFIRNIVPEVSPIGVSFVNQFSEASPLRSAAVNIDDSPRPVKKRDSETGVFSVAEPKTAEEIAAICHFEQALKYERSSYLDAALVSLHDALRCCEASCKPLQILHCRIMQSKSVLQWKLGRYTSAIQTLKWSVDTLSELPLTYKTTFADSLEATLLLSESHRQLAIVYMSCGTNSYCESIKQLQLSLKVCRHKMVEVKEFKRKAVRKFFSSKLLHSIAHSLTVLGTIQKERGHHTKAMGLFQRGLQILVQQEAASPPKGRDELRKQEQQENMLTYRSNSALIAHTLNHMGELFQFQKGDSHTAMDMYSEALWLYRVCLGHQHVDVAMTMLHMGQVHMEWNEFLEAKEAFAEALKIFENILGSTHRNVATTLWYMANMQLLERNFGQALEHFEESLEIQRQCLGDFHPDVAATYHAMAKLYEEAQQPQHALQLYNYAWQINKHNVGKDHVDSLSVAEDMVRMNSLYNRQRQEKFLALR